MKLKILLTLLLLTSLFPPSYVYAEPSDAYHMSGADALDSGEYVSEDEKSGNAQINITEKLLNIITGGISQSLKGALQTLGVIIGLLIVSSVLRNTAMISESKALQTSCDFISIAVISALLFSRLSNLFNYVVSCISAVNTYTKALLPVMASLYSLGGCIESAVTSSASTYLFLTFTEMLSADVILPLLSTGFAMALASALPGGVDLSSVCSLIKKTVTAVLSFIFALFSFVITVRSFIAQSADNMAFRSIKFVSGTFIPVIGNVLGDSARTVFASVGVIRSTVGAAGMISILSLTIPPIISVFLYKTVLSVCGAVARSVSLSAESKLTDGLNELLGILTAILAGCSVIFIIICAFFMKAGIDL